MTLLYKRALALTLLVTATQTTTPMNYRNVTMLASAGIATAVTATMVYNYFYPASAQTMIDRANTECQSIKTLHNDISFVHENELIIIDQDSKSATNTETFKKIKKEINPKYNNYALCHYVRSIDYEISQLQEKVQELAYLQTNLFNRSPKKSDDTDNESIMTNFDNAISDIQALRAELKDLITKLFTIRTHVASTPEYSYELERYLAGEETPQEDDSNERYERCVAICEEEEKTKTPDAPATTVSAPEVTAVVVETTTVETTTTESSSRAPFNSDWCDATNPFNS